MEYEPETGRTGAPETTDVTGAPQPAPAPQDASPQAQPSAAPQAAQSADHTQPPRGENNPSGAQNVYNAQNPYGAQNPYSAQPPYNTQNVYGAQNPSGAQNAYNAQTPYGAQPPYGGQYPSGAQYPYGPYGYGAQAPYGGAYPYGAQNPYAGAPYPPRGRRWRNGAEAVRANRAGEPAEPKKRRGRGGLYLAGLIVFFAVFCTVCGLAARAVTGARAEAAASESVPEQFTLDALPEELDGGLSTAEIAQKVSPSVVAINAYSYGVMMVSSGSGIVMNEDGYIITNAHVVEGASSAMVLLEDGRELVATIVGMDTRTDLAVLRVNADGLVPAEFGDSDTLVVGERAVAIGNAAGYLTGTTTQGCISGLNRSLDFEDAEGNAYTLNLIQTDASINPGNSGGALVNRYGQVIGINTARLADNDYQGIGFAIPISDAKPVLESLIATGRAPGKPLLGVTVLALTPVTGPANGLPSEGLYISEMTPECSLWDQGVTPGDVIVSANGAPVAQTDDLTGLIAEAQPGDSVELEIYFAATGETRTVTAVLYESAD